MQLNRTNAEAVLEPLTDLIDSEGGELREAAESWLDLLDENDADSREERAGHRDTWDENIGTVESQAIALVEAFGYAAVPRKTAVKAGLVGGPKHA